MIKKIPQEEAKLGRPTQCEEVRVARRVFGERLKKTRQLTGLNRVEFSRQIRSDGYLGVSLDPETLKGWETGKATPSGYYLGEWIRVLEETRKMAPGGLPWSFVVSMALRLDRNEWFWQRLEPENDEDLRLGTLLLVINKLFEGKDLETKLRGVISVLSDDGDTIAVERALSRIFCGEDFVEPDEEVIEPADRIGDSYSDWEPPPVFTASKEQTTK